MRWSIYVVCFEFDDSVMLYKSITDGLFELPINEYKAIKVFLENGDGRYLSDITKKHISELYLNKIIVDDNIDEAKLFKNEYLKRAAEAETGTVYFAPSFLCNLKCTYCIIGERINHACHDKYMQSSVVENSAEYVYKTTVRKGIKKLNIILYGGEPILAHTSNVLFINKMTELNYDQKIRIRYTLVTNGYEMPEDVINELLDLGVDNLQVTLDGPAYIHDARRIGAQGEKTFDVILQHLCEFSLKFKSVVIRINVDNTNVGSICELIDILKDRELNKHCILHLNLVDPSGYSDASGYNDETTNYFDEIYRYAYFKGFRVAPWRRYCSMFDKMYLAIDSKGNIYNCPNYMDVMEKIVGNVCDLKYDDAINFGLDDRCVGCCFVGICNGGCEVMRQNSNVGTDYCFKNVNYQMTKSYFGARYHRFSDKFVN